MGEFLSNLAELCKEIRIKQLELFNDIRVDRSTLANYGSGRSVSNMILYANNYIEVSRRVVH